MTLDLTQARLNFGSDENLLHEIANVFVEDVPGIADELKAAWLRNDFQTVARLAHSLKGLCATFGAEPSRTYAQRIELDATNCRSAVTMEKVYKLLDTLQQTLSLYRANCALCLAWDLMLPCRKATKPQGASPVGQVTWLALLCFQTKSRPTQSPSNRGLGPETLSSFRISSLLCSSVPLRFHTVCLKHGEILKRRGNEEQRKT